MPEIGAKILHCWIAPCMDYLLPFMQDKSRYKLSPNIMPLGDEMSLRTLFHMLCAWLRYSARKLTRSPLTCSGRVWWNGPVISSTCTLYTMYILLNRIYKVNWWHRKTCTNAATTPDQPHFVATIKMQLIYRMILVTRPNY